MHQQQQLYEVESIKDKRNTAQGVEYLIKWKDYPDDQSTWENEKSCSNILDIVKKFEASISQNPLFEAYSLFNKIGKSDRPSTLKTNISEPSSAVKIKQSNTKTKRKRDLANQKKLNQQESPVKKMNHLQILIVDSDQQSQQKVQSNKLCTTIEQQIAKQPVNLNEDKGPKVRRINHHFIKESKLFYQVNYQGDQKPQMLTVQQLQQKNSHLLIQYLNKRLMWCMSSHS